RVCKTSPRAIGRIMAGNRICSEKRLTFSSFSEQTRSLQYSPLGDSGRANPPKAKQFAFGPKEYPCYKVVAFNGELTGYSAPGGLATKRKLLKKDGIQIEKGRVPSRYFYSFVVR
ncbi:MAG: MGMT family protein, partial [bacterium]|nr:MGMT family protein [bacterium]